MTEEEHRLRRELETWKRRATSVHDRAVNAELRLDQFMRHMTEIEATAPWSTEIMLQSEPLKFYVPKDEADRFKRTALMCVQHLRFMQECLEGSYANRDKRAREVLEQGLDYHEHDGHNMPKQVARMALAVLGVPFDKQP